MTEIYCFVDDFLKGHTSLAHWRRPPNDEPSFTDAEVITIALMQSCLGVDPLKQTYYLISNGLLACTDSLLS